MESRRKEHGMQATGFVKIVMWEIFIRFLIKCVLEHCDVYITMVILAWTVDVIVMQHNWKSKIMHGCYFKSIFAVNL